MTPKIFNFKKFIKKSGKLLPITFDKKFPINVKRIFLSDGILDINESKIFDKINELWNIDIVTL